MVFPQGLVQAGGRRQEEMKMTPNDYDVLVVGAGLSGIGAGVHLSKLCPQKRYAVLEGRQRLGGTWDLFRYPGVRSDSDMYTLGYPFRPWNDRKSISSGSSILKYIEDTAREYGIDNHILYEHNALRASWSSEEARWTVEVAVGPEKTIERYSCNFLYMCSGYYSYKAGYLPEFPGLDQFQGTFIHPQQWPDNMDYAGKRVIVIGSGATAITIVPAMAEQGAQVTMLQRTPTYCIAFPEVDPVARALHAVLPERAAASINRLKNIWLATLFFQASRRFPKLVRKGLLAHVRRQLRGACDVDKHFNPPYNPWDQRLCLVANGDLFKAIRADKVRMVTDHIETFTEKGIKLRSGEELEADIIISATGLDLVPMGEMSFTVDGQPVVLNQVMTYKGMMLEDVPNMAQAIGYTNASWTLKCELTSQYVCRLLNYMDQHGYQYCMPHNNDPAVVAEPFLDFSSGYIQRALERFPKMGSKAPWKLYQNYVLDLLSLRYAPVTDKAMAFSRAKTQEKQLTLSSAA
jgi:cation diffusion facilitator CzcD-associated flavoprotein CzcO